MKIFKLVLAWIMFLGGLICWPLAAFWWAPEEPKFVLGLSFLALIYEGFNAIQIASKEKKESDDRAKQQ